MLVLLDPVLDELDGQDIQRARILRVQVRRRKDVHVRVLRRLARKIDNLLRSSLAQAQAVG